MIRSVWCLLQISVPIIFHCCPSHMNCLFFSLRNTEKACGCDPSLTCKSVVMVMINTQQIVYEICDLLRDCMGLSKDKICMNNFICPRLDHPSSCSWMRPRGTEDAIIFLIITDKWRGSQSVTHPREAFQSVNNNMHHECWANYIMVVSANDCSLMVLISKTVLPNPTFILIQYIIFLYFIWFYRCTVCTFSPHCLTLGQLLRKDDVTVRLLVLYIHLIQNNLSRRYTRFTLFV